MPDPSVIFEVDLVAKKPTSLERTTIPNIERKMQLAFGGKGRALGTMTKGVAEFDKSLEAATARTLAFAASASVFAGIGVAIKGMVEQTIKIPKLLGEINVILGVSKTALADFGDSLFDIGKFTGQTFDVAANAAKEFARQGLGAAETAKRTRDALVLVQQGGLDAEAAVSGLTAAINSFTQAGITSTQIVNKLANVDAKFAVSSADLINAIQRVGSTAEDSGVDIDRLSGLVTAAQQITSRGGAVIGNALKTIFTRINRPETLEQIEELGVAVRDTANKVLPADVILRDLAVRFKDLDDSSRSFIVQLGAGVYQGNQFRAILSDLAKGDNSIATRATAISQNSQNEAYQRTEELRKSLSSQGNAALLEIQRISAAVGQLTVAPALEKLFAIPEDLTAFASSFGDSGKAIGTAILSGIGDVISGPGLIIIFASLGKLIANFGREAFIAFKKVSEIGGALAVNRQIEQSIIGVLSNEKALRDGILGSTISQAVAEQKILDILHQQAIEEQRLATFVGNAVPNFGGKRVNRAGGYIPASSLSQNDIAKEVSGAQRSGYSISPSDVRAMNTNVGGKPTTVVYNSKEKLINNYAGTGETAIIPPNKKFAAFGLNELLSPEDDNNLQIADNIAKSRAARRARRQKAAQERAAAEREAKYAEDYEASRQRSNQKFYRNLVQIPPSQSMRERVGGAASSAYSKISDRASAIREKASVGYGKLQDFSSRNQNRFLGAGIATSLGGGIAGSALGQAGFTRTGRAVEGIASSVGIGATLASFGPLGVVAGALVASFGSLNTIIDNTKTSVEDLGNQFEKNKEERQKPIEAISNLNAAQDQLKNNPNLSSFQRNELNATVNRSLSSLSKKDQERITSSNFSSEVISDVQNKNQQQQASQTSRENLRLILQESANKKSFTDPLGINTFDSQVFKNAGKLKSSLSGSIDFATASDDEVEALRQSANKSVEDSAGIFTSTDSKNAAREFVGNLIKELRSEAKSNISPQVAIQKQIESNRLKFLTTERSLVQAIANINLKEKLNDIRADFSQRKRDLGGQQLSDIRGIVDSKFGSSFSGNSKIDSDFDTRSRDLESSIFNDNDNRRRSKDQDVIQQQTGFATLLNDVNLGIAGSARSSDSKKTISDLLSKITKDPTQLTQTDIDSASNILGGAVTASTGDEKGKFREQQKALTDIINNLNSINTTYKVTDKEAKELQETQRKNLEILKNTEKSLQDRLNIYSRFDLDKSLNSSRGSSISRSKEVFGADAGVNAFNKKLERDPRRTSKEGRLAIDRDRADALIEQARITKQGFESGELTNINQLDSLLGVSGKSAKDREAAYKKNPMGQQFLRNRSILERGFATAGVRTSNEKIQGNVEGFISSLNDPNARGLRSSTSFDPTKVRRAAQEGNTQEIYRQLGGTNFQNGLNATGIESLQKLFGNLNVIDKEKKVASEAAKVKAGEVTGGRNVSPVVTNNDYRTMIEAPVSINVTNQIPAGSNVTQAMIDTVNKDLSDKINKRFKELADHIGYKVPPENPQKPTAK